MKKYVFLSLGLIAVLSLGLFSFISVNGDSDQNTIAESKTANADAIQWMSIEDAIDMEKKAKKGFFVDVYTDWCGWCKVMDKKTFTDPEVIKYINENYYAVKFNAEQKESINYKGQDYEFVNSGRRGVNKFAHKMLNGRLGYPSFVITDKNMKTQKILKGFQKSDQLLRALESVK
jgi:thiol:disulfide interchange protein